MKNPLSSIYEQILLTEAEKSKLEHPSNDTVGKLAPKQDFFGEKPKAVEGAGEADVNKPVSGPKYKVDAGSTSKPKADKSSFKGAAPAKSEEAEEGEEMEDTDVTPETEEEKKEVKKESFTMSAFEKLFKKTLTEEVGEMSMETEADDLESDVEDLESDVEEEESDVEETEEEEEGDLVSDLKELQDKLTAILSNLEGAMEENEGEMGDDEEYSDADFDGEFGNEEEEVKEALEKPKALPSAHGKKLMSKKNKVGKVNPKGGKASPGSVKSEPQPKALGDKKASLQKGLEAKSNVKKGEFFK
tara:strand:+ start:1767 stop:2672 length:906 start_codon:yes stop_codon:yes gene_type:complete